MVQQFISKKSDAPKYKNGVKRVNWAHFLGFESLAYCLSSDDDESDDEKNDAAAAATASSSKRKSAVKARASPAGKPRKPTSPMRSAFASPSPSKIIQTKNSPSPTAVKNRPSHIKLWSETGDGANPIVLDSTDESEPEVVEVNENGKTTDAKKAAAAASTRKGRKRSIDGQQEEESTRDVTPITSSSAASSRTQGPSLLPRVVTNPPEGADGSQRPVKRPTLPPNPTLITNTRKPPPVYQHRKPPPQQQNETRQHRKNPPFSSPATKSRSTSVLPFHVSFASPAKVRPPEGMKITWKRLRSVNGNDTSQNGWTTPKELLLALNSYKPGGHLRVNKQPPTNNSQMVEFVWQQHQPTNNNDSSDGVESKNSHYRGILENGRYWLEEACLDEPTAL